MTAPVRGILPGLKAAPAYFAIVFAVAFAAGTVRVLLVAPKVGEIAAVLLEAPVLLAVSWLASRWVAARFGVGTGAAERLAMGLGAFALLMIAEPVSSLLLFGQSLAQYIAAFARPAAMLGLAAQLGFAFIPYLQEHRS